MVCHRQRGALLWGAAEGFRDMQALRKLALFAALGMSLPLAAAHAADMPAPYVAEQFSYGGWYFRADIGFSNQRVGSLYNVLYETTEVTNVFAEFGAAPFGGIGIGYAFNNFFRIDVTGEYRGKAAFDGTDTYLFNDVDPEAVDPEPNWVTRIDDYEANKSEWTFLANAYWDIGNFHGFVPFIGAGAGFSYNTISGFTDTDPTDGEWFDPSMAFGDTASTWNFAWAFYAGAGYQVTDKLTLEFAYRFIALGDAQSGDLYTYLGENEIDNPMFFRNLTSHDFKIGFRYAIN
jgi:opacity protein-like surface antigen